MTASRGVGALRGWVVTSDGPAGRSLSPRNASWFPARAAGTSAVDGNEMAFTHQRAWLVENGNLRVTAKHFDAALRENIQAPGVLTLPQEDRSIRYVFQRDVAAAVENSAHQPVLRYLFEVTRQKRSAWIPERGAMGL